MAITQLSQMYNNINPNNIKHLVAVWANDIHTIEAVSLAIDKNIVKGTLVGDKNTIISICKNANININKFNIVNANTDIEAAETAVQIVAKGQADILMKGLITTDKYMRAILNKDAGLLAPKAILSHVTVVESSYYNKLLIVSDVAIIPQPDLQQKIAIIKYLTQTANALGIDNPKIAIISASEQVLPNISSSAEAALISKMAERGQITGAIIDGPLSLDAAIDMQTAQTKNINSNVAGNADCLLFPNLDAGNVFYKMTTKMSNAQTATFVAGAKVPCVLSSRGDTTLTKLNSIALCSLLALNK